jgi:glycosyltransferase involved in cell wall biosynthesis
MTAAQTNGARRVALVIGQLTVGGAEKQLGELVRGLDRGRFAPYVYSLTDAASTVRAYVKALDVPVRTVGGKGLARAWRLVRALRDDRVELVHAWLFIANTYTLAARLLGLRVPLVTSARNCKSQGWGHHLGNVAAFRGSARILVNAEQVRDYVVRHYAAPPGRIAVVYNGVDTRRFRPEAGRADGPPRIVTVGRLVAQKNPLLFVEAAARVHQAEPSVRFVLVGDGPLRAAVEEQARALGLGAALEVLGERGDVEEVLRGAHLFWLTSSWEGMPNVVLEAMASGLPVVASDVGGTRELITSGGEGFLVRPYHAEEFVHYTLDLVRDRDLRRRLGDAARRRALGFSLERMVSGTEAVYAAALGGRAR